jgi:hypothetical protein
VSGDALPLRFDVPPKDYKAEDVPWSRYGQVEGWEHTYLVALQFWIGAGVLSAFVIAFSVVLTWAVVQVDGPVWMVLLLVTPIVLLVLGLERGTRVMRRSLMRVMPTDRESTVAGIERSLHGRGIEHHTQDELPRRVRLGRRFKDVYVMEQGRVWVGVGRSWWSENPRDTQIVLGPTTRENETLVARIAWALDRDLDVLGVRPVDRRYIYASGGLPGVLVGRSGAGAANRLGSRPWRTYPEVTGWARPSDQDNYISGAFLTFLAAGVFLAMFVLLSRKDLKMLDILWTVMLVVGVITTIITLVRGREGRKNLVKHIGLPPSILADVASGALQEAQLQFHRLHGAEAVAKHGNGCLEAFEVGDVHVRVKNDPGAAGPLGSDSFGIFMGPANNDNEGTLSTIAWHIERLLERRRTDEKARQGA